MGSDRVQRGVSLYRLCECAFVFVCVFVCIYVCVFVWGGAERGGARRVSWSLYGFIWLSLGRLM